MSKKKVTIDGNTAAANIAYAFSEVAAIYPITPSSPMGENTDLWSSEGLKNIFGSEVDVVEMQSEAGAAGAVHGALSAGALTSTFTSSQGLLLMIPNMHKIAGEMLPTVFHVAARSLAAQSLSIFGDHSDVMSVRNTGFALIAANSIQETMDLALISHLATLNAQIPFLNFFDGFRTSHEVQKVEDISYDTISELLEPDYITRFKNRALRPEAPVLKVAAQNPDVYFQGRETVNKYYDALPQIIQDYMDKVAKVTGRQYHLFDYVGHPEATEVIVAMGSGADTIEHTIKYLNEKENSKLGLIKVRLFNPFSVKDFVNAIPKSCKKIAVLDRTKEPGAIGEPLYLNVVASLIGKDIAIIGGRYGLSSKEFSPSMVKAVYEHLNGKCTHGFTVGINDDVTMTSIEINDTINIEPDDVTTCMFWGLGSDGTVGANKNSIKIIGENTDLNVQAYFVYDSKKSGGVTVSHLRFGESHVNYPYLINCADFVACHNQAYLGRYDMFAPLKEGATFILNSDIDSSEVFSKLTKEDQQILIDRKINFYNIDALKIAQEVGLGVRINTVMQTVFFKVSGVLPEDKSIELIKNAIKKSFSKKGEDIVEMNWKCVDRSLDALEKVQIPSEITKSAEKVSIIPDTASDFAKEVMEPTILFKGDDIPVSKMSFDGVLPVSTSCLEKRGIALQIPKWKPEHCIQCNQCVMACPHAVIRAKQMDPELLKDAHENFVTLKSKTKNDKNLKYRIQVYAEDCTGCGVCIETCPAKTKALEYEPLDDARAAGQAEMAVFFDNLPDNVVDGVNETGVKGTQFKLPLFEFSGACAGCGETPYVKLLTQICGEHTIIANATGCSSIYGGTFPAVPYRTAKNGRGPAWANSLFEDNAEYGLGMRVAVDNNRKLLRIKVRELLEKGTDDKFASALSNALEVCVDNCTSSEALDAQNAVKELLPNALKCSKGETKVLLSKIDELSDYFIDKYVWILGGDGWAYDIGYGGLDHAVASGKNVNILVLDTEVYSNTGGQASKSTPIAATAKFATAGMRTPKKKLDVMCMSYGYVYVASVSLGANKAQTLKAFNDAIAYNGPSIILAYSPCIAHGINMMKSPVEQKLAVECGYWPLYRFNPEAQEGKRLVWESKKQDGDYQKFIRSERRYSTLLKTAPNEAEALFAKSEEDAHKRMQFYQKMSDIM